MCGVGGGCGRATSCGLWNIQMALYTQQHGIFLLLPLQNVDFFWHTLQLSVGMLNDFFANNHSLNPCF